MLFGNHHLGASERLFWRAKRLEKWEKTVLFFRVRLYSLDMDGQFHKTPLMSGRLL